MGITEMMKKTQKGFTLIELMIVVAIIGILAAVAIPAYQDYIARAQASEAVTLLGGAKTPLAEYYADNGAFPPDAASFLEIVPNQAGKYIASMTLTDQNDAEGEVTVEATFRTTGVSARLQVGGAGGTVGIRTTTGGNTWACGTTGTTNELDSDALLPAACREDLTVAGGTAT